MNDPISGKSPTDSETEQNPDLDQDTLSPVSKEQPEMSPDLYEEAAIAFSHYSGPIPHPAILGLYEEVLPGSAERILAMTEKQQDFRHSQEKMVLTAEVNDLKADREEARRGQNYALAIALVVVTCGTITAALGHGWAATGIMGTGTAPVVASFINGRRRSGYRNSTSNQDLTEE